MAGTDGEKMFNAVFGEQARTVAVLLRPEWGHTSWTRIEETAIRNRAHEHGYDFTTFIVTAPGTSPPAWLPKARIWYDFERFGLDGAAAVLASRVQEHGGDAIEETLADKAARLQRARDFNEARQRFQRSDQGVNAAQEAYKRLVGDLKANAELLRCRVLDVAYGGVTVLVGEGVVLTVQCEFRYVNSLEDTRLVAGFYDGVPHLPSLMTMGDPPHTLDKWTFTFGLVGPSRTGWVGPEGKEHGPEALAEFLQKHFLELQQRQLG